MDQKGRRNLKEIYFLRRVLFDRLYATDAKVKRREREVGVESVFGSVKVSSK